MAAQTQTTIKWKPALANASGNNESPLKFIRPSELAEAGTTGVIAQGTFLKAVPNKLDDRKNDFYVALEDGTTAVLNSSGSLENQMRNVKPGSLIQVIYSGMKEIKTGKLAGKSVHEFKVNVAE
jgi:hypothetical protein